MISIPKRLAASAAIVATALGVGGLTAGSASAAQTPRAPKPAFTSDIRATTVSSTATATFTGKTAGRATPSVTARCTITQSGLHFLLPGDVWGPDFIFTPSLGTSAAVSCTGVVPEAIVVQASVFDFGVATSGSPIGSSGSPQGGPAFADVQCQAGLWQSGGDAIVDLPPNFEPPQLDLSVEGPPVTLTDTDCP
jgi:hypothetical protein